jgi:glycerate kinase
MPVAKIIIAPDRFPESLSSDDFCEAVKEEILKRFPNDRILTYPLADGGEGTAGCVLKLMGGERVTGMSVNGQLANIFATYLIKDDLAVIEADAVLKKNVVETANPRGMSSYGVGLLIKDAISRGVQKIILGLGGCAAVDGGCGMAAALGTVFYNGSRKVFLPVGERLSDIKSFDSTNTASLLKGINLTALTDVTNPFYGNGGKAEGIEAGVLTFLKGSLESGASYLIRMSQLENELEGADLIITGEESFDVESRKDKITDIIIKLAEKHNVPVLVLCGQHLSGELSLKKGHIVAINPENMPPHIAIKETRNNLKYTVSELIKEDII